MKEDLACERPGTGKLDQAACPVPPPRRAQLLRRAMGKARPRLRKCQVHPVFIVFPSKFQRFSIEFPAFFIDFQPELAMFIGFLHAFPLQAEFTKAQKLHRKELGLGVLLDPATLWPKLNRSRVRPILNA